MGKNSTREAKTASSGCSRGTAYVYIHMPNTKHIFKYAEKCKMIQDNFPIFHRDNTISIIDIHVLALHK
jgi:hypothetical protein